jgi:hypothetical protein
VPCADDVAEKSDGRLPSVKDVNGRANEDTRDAELRVWRESGRRSSVGGVRSAVYCERTTEPAMCVHVCILRVHAYYTLCMFSQQICFAIADLSMRTVCVCVCVLPVPLRSSLLAMADLNMRVSSLPEGGTCMYVQYVSDRNANSGPA